MKKVVSIFCFISLLLITNLCYARGLPKGFYVSESDHNSYIVFAKRMNGNVTVRMDLYDFNGSSFQDLVNDLARSNGSASCTKMKNDTPVGGPRFHCTDNTTRQPYTLHVAPVQNGKYVMSIIISGDNYPGFGITYDDVNRMIDYWFYED